MGEAKEGAAQPAQEKRLAQSVSDVHPPPPESTGGGGLGPDKKKKKRRGERRESDAITNGKR